MKTGRDDATRETDDADLEQASGNQNRVATWRLVEGNECLGRCRSGFGGVGDDALKSGDDVSVELVVHWRAFRSWARARLRLRWTLPVDSPSSSAIAGSVMSSQ
jgi:hypothetical protein